jgi:hypothetical protein
MFDCRSENAGEFICGKEKKGAAPPAKALDHKPAVGCEYMPSPGPYFSFSKLSFYYNCKRRPVSVLRYWPID